MSVARYLTRDEVETWIRTSGHNVATLASWTNLDHATLSKWLAGDTENLRRESAGAVSAAVRAARYLALTAQASPASGGAAQSDDPATTEEVMEMARATSAQCIALWRTVVADGGAPTGMRMRAAEYLMAYAHGKPPKLQAEEKREGPKTTDSELLAKLQAIGANGK